MRSNQIDVVENGAIVKVFLLEAAFPFNVEEDMLNSAGSFWESYALTHAALGFLVEENQSRHVLEYYALDYAGSFLPEAPPPPPTPAPAPSTRGPTSAPTSSPTPQHSLAPSTPPTGGGNSSDTASPSPAPSSITTLPPTAVRTDAEVSRGHGGPREEGEEEQRGPVEGLNAASFESEAIFVGREERGVWDGMRGGNGTAELTWNNEANVRASSGFDEIVWASANYVGKITGLLYNDITGWSNDYLEKHPTYQPISACGGSSDRGGKGDFGSKGSSDSYDFVWAAFERLASNGLIFEQQVVLPPKRTVMCLFPEGGVDAAELVEAAGNEEIEHFYRDTGACVRKLAASAAAGSAAYPGTACASPSSSSPSVGEGWSGEGGVSVLLGIGSCFQNQDSAFLYHNSSHYLHLPLPAGANKTSMVATASAASTEVESTARLVRYAPAMPPRPLGPPGGPDRAYIVYIAVALAAVGFAAAGLRALYWRKKASVAYGRGSGEGRDGSMFSSGWRGGASDFGEFDRMNGGSYEGALFPTDNYSSESLSGSRSQHGGGSGILGGWRGGGRASGSGGPMEAETVQLKRPLLNPSSETSLMPQTQQQTAAGSSTALRRSRDEPKESRGVGGGSGTRNSGKLSSAINRASEGSPPPFSRIMGTMGGGPQTTSPGGRKKSARGGDVGGSGGQRFSERRARERRTKEVSFEESGEAAVEKGPFGDHDNNDPFIGGGGGGGGGNGALKRGDEADGDEVFC